MPKPRFRFRVVLQSGLVLLLCLIAAELALRIATLLPLEGNGFRKDSILGFRSLPLQRSPTGLIVNSLGFNDRESPPVEAKAVFIGDSFTFGLFHYSEVFPHQVAKLMGGEATFPVASLGIPGAGPKEYRRVIANELPRFRPEHVIVTLFVGNDVLQADPDYETILYAGELLLLPAPWSLGGSWFDYYLPRVLRMTFRRLKLEAFPCDDPARLEAINQRVTPYLSRVYNAEMPLYAPRYDKRMQRAADGLVAETAAMVAAIRSMGAKPLVVIAPSELQLNPKLRQTIGSCYDGLGAGYDFDKPQSWLTEALRAAGIPYLDLMPAFRNHPPESLYEVRDTHWNVAGNQLVAEAIARRLRELQ